MKLALELKTSHQKLSIEKIMDSRNHSFNLPPAHLPSAVSEEEALRVGGFALTIGS